MKTSILIQSVLEGKLHDKFLRTESLQVQHKSPNKHHKKIQSGLYMSRFGFFWLLISRVSYSSMVSMLMLNVDIDCCRTGFESHGRVFYGHDGAWKAPFISDNCLLLHSIPGCIRWGVSGRKKSFHLPIPRYRRTDFPTKPCV